MSTRSPSIPGSATGDLLKRLLAELQNELEFAAELRERLHRLAEPSQEERRTAEVVDEALPPTFRHPLDGAGFLTRVGPTDGPAIILRAELDALPIVERTGARFAATNGHMHACGHDIHMAALTATVRAAERLESELPASLVALFQPSEESYPSGAQAVASRIAEFGPIRAIVAMHVHPDVPWESVAADEGPVNAAADNFSVVVRGRGGHAAYPHQALDPVVCLSQIVSTLQQVVSRRIDPMHPVAITVSFLRAGSAENAIAESAEARGTLRALDPDDRQTLRDLVQEVVEHVAQACGCRGEMTLTEGEPAVVNDPALAVPIRTMLSEANFRIASPFRSCGSDDFGYYGRVAPSFLGFVGLDGAPGFERVPLHHPQFLPPVDAIAAVARAHIAAFAGLAGSAGAQEA